MGDAGVSSFSPLITVPADPRQAVYAPVAMPRTMRGLGVILAGFALCSGAPASAQSPESKTINTYCATCHNGRLRSPSGPLLDQLDASQIAANPALWSRAYRQLQAGAMPPAGAPRPSRAEADATLLS